MKTSECIIVLFVAVPGCGSGDEFESSDYEWVNHSRKRIWVDEASGFERDPRCGVLSPEGMKELFLEPQHDPENTIVVWWFGERDDRPDEPFRTTIPLAGKREHGRQTLVFQFGPDETWRASFHDADR